MKTLLRIVSMSVIALIVIALGLFAAYRWGTQVQPRGGFAELTATQHGDDQHPTVSIDGRLLGGELAIGRVSEYRQDRGIVVVVRVGITRPGRDSGRFHYDVAVPAGVEHISFANADDVIWAKKP